MATAAATLPSPLPAIRRVHHWQERLAQGLLVMCCAALALFLFAPLFMILVKSVQDKDGAFVGLLQFQQYFQTPALRQSIANTLWIDWRSAGVWKYCWNCSKPTNAPSLSCTLLTRIMKSGANRKSARAAQHMTSSPCARRSCQ